MISAIFLPLRRHCLFVTLAACGLVTTASGSAVAAAPVPQILYDGASAKLPSTAPWQWVFLGDGIPLMDPQGLVSLSTTLSQKGGYNSFGVATLDRNIGFRIEFGLQMGSESHQNEDRSGTSVIVLDGSALGVEISFWTNKVFVKNADTAFSQGEGRALDTTIERRYTLEVHGNSYSLNTPGMSALSGPLRNYFADAADTFSEQFVYGQRNYIFVGDDTTSAGAQFMLRDVTVSAVPEPSQFAAMIAGLGLLSAVLGRTQARPTRV